MPQRLASVMALLAFAVCLITGGAAENPFSTTVGRALLAMAVTFVIAMVVGMMAQKMIEENVSDEKKKLSDLETK